MWKHVLPVLFFCTLLALPGLVSAQWTKTNGLSGGDVGGFLRFGDTVLVQAGRLHFSANHGQSWTPLAPTGLTAIADMATEGTGIYCRGYQGANGTAISSSTDFGQTWTLHKIPDSLYFSDFFATPGYLYGNYYQGLYRSADQGAHWEKVPASPVGCLQSDGQRMVGCRLNRIVESLDGGFTWDTLLTYSGNVIDLLQEENYLFAFLQNASQGCWASSDYGQTWQHFTGTGFDQFYDFVWQEGSLYGLKGSKLYRSDDLGNNWKAVNVPGTGYGAYAGIASGGSILIGGLSSGILRSTDHGDSWFAANQGLLAAAPAQLSVTDQGLFAPATKGIFQLQPDGINWENKNYPIQLPWYSYGYSSFMQAGDYLLAGTGGEAPQVSVDGGSHWVPSFVADGFGGGSFSPLGQSGSKIIGTWDNGDWTKIYVSDNNGLTFQLLNTLATQFNTSIDFIEVHAGRINVLAYDGQIYQSANGGENWSLLASDFPQDSFYSLSSYDTRLFVRGNSIWVFGDFPDRTLAFSADLGQHWEIHHLASANLTWGTRGFNELLNVGNYLLAATDVGLFLSSDNGLNWTAWNEGLGLRYSSSIQFYDGYIWAGIQGDGIWKRPVTELGLQPATGTVFHDQDGDGQQDAGEPGLANVIVQSLGSVAYANTQADGSFNLLSGLAQEEIRVQLPAPYWTASPASQTVTLPAAGANFALALNPASQDLSVALTNTAVLRPGFESAYVLTWRNRVPVPAADVTVELAYPADQLEFVSAIPAPTGQSSGLLKWQPGAAAPNATGAIQIIFKVPATVDLGMEVCAMAKVGPSAGDLFPADNARTHCATVVGSYDPNDKQAEPATQITPAAIAAREPMVYTIRFQNTGNFPASFVRITDTLSAYAEVATFQLLSASHPCTWTLLHAGEVTFNFSNIDLPPITSDEVGSHGFVQYAVQARPDLPLGTPLLNTAHIFFDYNAPITTNTTKTVVSLVNPVRSPESPLEISIFPNPATEVVRLNLSAAGLLTVADAAGRLVWQSPVAPGRTELDVRNWPAGAYRLQMDDGERQVIGKLLVQH